MTPDLPTLRALYPEFDSVADGVVTLYLDDAIESLSATAWGRCYAKAVMLYTSHTLSLALQRQASAVDGVAQQVGILQAGAEEKINFTFARSAPASTSAEWLSLTPYGMEYAALQRQCLGRAMLSW